MINLLRSGYTKLFRNRVYLICLIIVSLAPVLITLTNISGRNGNQAGPLNGICDTGLNIIWMAISFFVSVFIGKEYDEKTVRNKIIAGHSRAAIYFSDLIVVLSGALLMQLACFVTGTAVSVPIFGMYDEPLISFIISEISAACIITFYTTLVMMISTVISSKIYAQSVSMVLVMIIAMAGTIIFESVSKNGFSPEQIAAISAAGTENMKAFIFKYEPQSQAMIVLSGGAADFLPEILFTNIISSAVFTLAGALIFRKKDLN